jgi:hypothetical protein
MRMKLRRPLFTLLTFLGFGVLASAGTYTFNFDSLPGSGSGANSTNNSTAIATYMTTYLQTHGCTGCSVSVAGAVSDQGYTGEGNVVGPTSGHTVSPVTLGNTNGATGNNASPGSTDTFLANTADNSSQVASQITLIFSGLQVASVSFDYEIFPDGTCPSLGYNNCGGAWWNSSTALSNNPNTPDLEFTTGSGAGTAVAAFGTGGIQYGVAPGSGDGNETHSTSSGWNSTETAPQYIGVSGTLALGNVTELNFVDWPATIGIDNLVITTSTPPVPEPSSVLLFGTAGLGVFLSLRRRFSKQS